MEELASLYKNHKAFYGWYLPVEDCICPIFAEHAVQSVNTLTEKAKSLTPGKKTLISPYGIGLSEFDHPDFEKQMWISLPIKMRWDVCVTSLPFLV